MFGYVTICREYMSAEDYDTFSAYYCGLCRTLGSECSQISRLGLSYDMTFLAVVLSSLDDRDINIREYRCAAHPAKRRKIIADDEAVRYAANMGALLMYLKCADDWADERSVKALAGYAALRRGAKRAGKRYPKLWDGIKEQLDALKKREEENARVDEAADCFAKILELLFAPDFISGEKTRRILNWFGYNIGRWIYVMDAYNDIERDLKSGSYNPFAVEIMAGAKKSDIAGRLGVTLTLNLDTAASAYELLNIRRNDGVIRHIIYTSLYAKQKKILGETDGSI